ncbi:putative methyltransferase-domain-containing protein [Gamsiella multidivaricata]|uniref:putative methyltransferase-domain-containing protein n=1 Tax=Gamsiella multidivaricata TaxID=101098 RepID=UPI00221E6484|nr:putative methyltransferase-domain-containing protein [Gamsiella multidivaricata]KAG0363948.1 Methyltransferase-like protein 21D [Gamsiella multidivaricata]KAI7819041.1 putative methyltransferase-domain-containing protein [Gamsiella multidivaricata]
MHNITLASREYEFNDTSITPLEIDEDPSGLLRGGVGSTIWDAAIVLAKYFERLDLTSFTSTTTPAESRIINVLELGSGTGIVGLAVARMLSAKGLKAKVVLTDKDNVVPLLQRNVAKNASPGIHIDTQVLDWEAISGINADATNTPAADGSSASQATGATEVSSSTERMTSVRTHTDLADINWDLVILSDCIWVPKLYGPLISTINTIIQPGSSTKLVVAFEKRNFSEEMEFFALLGKSFRFRDIKPEEQDTNYQSEDIYLFVCQRRTE